VEIERKSIPGFPSYFASKDGTIWKFKAGRFKVLQPSVNEARKGYLHVGPYKDGKNRTVWVHKLILLAFIGPRPDGMEIMHIDGDKTNNALSNLRYGTPVENNQDKKNHGTHLVGERCGSSKLTESQVVEIRSLYATGRYSQTTLAKMFGVTQTPISLIVRNKTWNFDLMGAT